MKKVIAVTIIITVLFSIALLAIPKHEVPTDLEWEAYLEWEQEFFEWRDGPAKEQCVYQIQNRDTHEVYFHGSLQECKDTVQYYELNCGECVIMPQ